MFGFPVAQLGLARFEDQALVRPKALETKVGQPGVLGILPAQDLAVARHGGAEAKQKVERASGSFADRRVAHRGHHDAHVEVASPHAHVAQLVGCLARQNNVVHDDQDWAVDTALPQLLLLLQELVDQRLVPLVEEEPLVPLGVGPHHRLEGGAARGRAHERHDQGEVIKRAPHEVHEGHALPASPRAHRRQHHGQLVFDGFCVESLEHLSF